MYTNHGDIPFTLAVWLAANDGYDFIPDAKSYSCTTLLAPVRSVILTRQMALANVSGSVDIAEMVPSRVGTAVHTAAEMAWLYSRNKAMTNLGIPQKIQDLIKINPDTPSANPEYDMYMEQRSTKMVGDITISGKFDFVWQGRIRDIKTTKTYNWIHGGNDKKYMMQESIYRWMNPEIITDDSCAIDFVFTDWSPLQASIDKDYPPRRIMERIIPMMSIVDTDYFVRKQVALLEQHKDSTQANLPKCTPDELWMKPAKFAYYKNPTGKRATKLYDTNAEALSHKSRDGNVGVIHQRIQEPTFCKYCDARPVCHQAEKYIEEGILKL